MTKIVTLWLFVASWFVAFPGFVVAEERLRVPGREISRQHNSIMAIAHSNRGHLLAAAQKDLGVDIIDTATGAIVIKVQGHESEVTEVGFSNDDSVVITASYDDTIRATEIKSGKSTLILRCESVHYPRIAVNAKSTEWGVIYCRASNELRGLSDLSKPSGRLLSTFDRKERVCSIAVSPDGKYIACGTEAAVAIFDAGTGALRGRREQKKSGIVTRLCFTADSKAVIFLSEEIEAWSVSENKQLYAIGDSFRGEAGAVTALRASSDGSLIAIAYSGEVNQSRGRVLLFDVQRQVSIGWFEGEHGGILDCVFVPAERKLITCGVGGKGITEWDLGKVWPAQKK